MADGVRCIECERFSLKGSSLARCGFGLCDRKPKHERQSAVFVRSCDIFVPAKDKGQAAAGEGWLKKQRRPIAEGTT